MKKIIPFSVLAALLVLAGGFMWKQDRLPDFSDKHNELVSGKMGGVSLVAPSSPVKGGWAKAVKESGAGWVILLPYAYSYQGKTEVFYDMKGQWWGERKEGVIATIRHATSQGLKVCLKPMVWIPGSWPGSFTMEDEEGWKAWEASYRNYILGLAKIGEAEGVSMMCIGTEFKISSAERPAFWRQLAKDVRAVFSGKVTYAANWDNFHKVTFWDAMDYIGVDAYFPLSDEELPTVKDLKRKWAAPGFRLQSFARRFKKKILFTEFGYRSVDQCAWKQWLLEKVPFHKQVNLQAQVNGYQAFFEYFWDKSWFAGAFLWQWYHNHYSAGGEKNSDYTIQRKPAADLVKTWFSK